MVFKNGMKVWVIEDSNYPVVSIQTWLPIGASRNPVGPEQKSLGLSRLTERLVQSQWASQPEAEILEHSGGVRGSFSTRDFTVFSVNIASHLIKPAIVAEQKRIKPQLFFESSFMGEKRSLLAERQANSEMRAARQLENALWNLAYTKHPYRLPVFPEENEDQDFLSVSLSDVQNFYDRYYLPAYTYVVVVGDVRAEEVFSEFKKWDLIEKATPILPQIPSEPVQTSERRLNLKVQSVVNKTSIALGYVITPADHPDTPALDVLNQILFVGRESRATRFKSAEQIVGVSFTPKEPGLFSISADLKSGYKSDDFIREVDQLIEEVKQNGVSSYELQGAVKQLQADLLEQTRTPAEFAQLVGTVLTVYSAPEQWIRDIKQYELVTSQQVQKVAAQYLLSQRRSIVVSDSKGAIKK